MTVPAFQFLWSSHDVANEHRRRYVRSGLERALLGAGLEPVKTSYYNAFLMPLAVVRKLMPWRNGGDHLETVPAPANAIMRRILGAEAPVMRRVDIPIGASLVATARPA
ncbi:MAG: hypothetical protein GEU28_11020 [Dehalococcoidia bacterium]|nr:hypothetical protein [Dehalococcoidia bacterium]